MVYSEAGADSKGEGMVFHEMPKFIAAAPSPYGPAFRRVFIDIF
jgi:hypothetical protein